jgi:hypothetical protein
MCRVPFAEIWTVVDKFTQINQKTAAQNFAAKRRETQMAEVVHVDFSEDFTVVIRRLRAGNGQNAGSRTITATHILKVNWYLTHSLDDDCEGGKRDA